MYRLHHFAYIKKNPVETHESLCNLTEGDYALLRLSLLPSRYFGWVVFLFAPLFCQVCHNHKTRMRWLSRSHSMIQLTVNGKSAPNYQVTHPFSPS